MKKDAEQPAVYKKSFEKRAEARLEMEKLETEKPALKPEDRDWKPLGVVDFSKHDMIGVSDTKNTRYHLDKQLKGVFNKSTDRSAVIKELGSQITSSGKLSKYSAKHALWRLQKSGKLTQGQVNKTFRKLGI